MPMRRRLSVAAWAVALAACGRRRKVKVPLHDGGWAGVLSDPALRSDPIHANAQGYEAFARGLAARARELGLAPA